MSGGSISFGHAGTPPPNSLSGGSSQRLTGAVYFPDATLEYTGGSSSDGGSATIVTRSIAITGNAYISQPATTQFTGGSGRIALVE